MCPIQLGETGRCCACKDQAILECHAIIACLELQANISNTDIATTSQGAWGYAYLVFFVDAGIHLPSRSRQCIRSGKLKLVLAMRLGGLHFG